MSFPAWTSTLPFTREVPIAIGAAVISPASHMENQNPGLHYRVVGQMIKITRVKCCEHFISFSGLLVVRVRLCVCQRERERERDR